MSELIVLINYNIIIDKSEVNWWLIELEKFRLQETPGRILPPQGYKSNYI